MIDSKGKFWEVKYRQHINKMTAICYRYVGNRQLAEDLAHDAFLIAIEKAASYRSKGSFEGWLRRITVNAALQYLRKRKKEEQFAYTLAEQLYEVEPDSDNLIEQADFSRRELLATLSKLPHHHRLVFNLYVIDRLTHAQIGEALGISSGTSKSHLARARKKLRQLLNEKAKEKLIKKQGKRGWLLFLLPFKYLSVDRWYYRSFHKYELAASKTASLKTLHLSNAPVPDFSTTLITAKNLLIAAIPLVAIIGITYLSVNQWSDDREIDASESKVTSSLTPTSSEKNNIFEELTATHSRNSILPYEDTLTQRNMRNLKKLGLTLLATGLMMESDGQPDTNRTVEAFQGQPMHNEMNESKNTEYILDNHTTTLVEESERALGTFEATNIFWSKEDNELYFQGKVKVNLGDSHFSGNGSFNTGSLGKVYFLVVDQQPIALDAKVHLSGKRCKVFKLSKEEAFKQYGAKGKQGAIEIVITE